MVFNLDANGNANWLKIQTAVREYKDEEIDEEEFRERVQTLGYDPGPILERIERGDI